MSKKILLVGSANMDLSMNMLRVPAAGETLIDDGGVAYLPGGKGANAAAAFSRLGGHCVFCTKLGADLHGQKLYSYYKDVGIDTSFVKVDHENPTGLAVVMHLKIKTYVATVISDNNSAASRKILRKAYRRLQRKRKCFVLFIDKEAAVIVKGQALWTCLGKCGHA